MGTDLEKLRAQQHRYYEKHRAKSIARSLRHYYENAQYREATRQRSLERFNRDRDHARELGRLSYRRCKKAAIARSIYYTGIYRARKAGAAGHYTRKQWRALCAKYDYKCLCCREVKPLVRDHIVALVNGGSNWITNIQPLCKKCNSRKGARTIDYRY